MIISLDLEGGLGVWTPPPHRKILSYMCFYRNKHLDPPPRSPEKVGPPLNPWKSIKIS